ncbi:MAG TPA: hypothetical protein DD706_22510 [Nitrospiraceae bacterium]|nr:hypothetical protein [Nitrospiraceae bacterium]
MLQRPVETAAISGYLNPMHLLPAIIKEFFFPKRIGVQNNRYQPLFGAVIFFGYDLILFSFSPTEYTPKGGRSARISGRSRSTYFQFFGFAVVRREMFGIRGKITNYF